MATPRSPRRRAFRIGGWLLFLLPLPLLLKVLSALGEGEFGTLVISTIAFGLLLAGAWLTRKGLYQE